MRHARWLDDMALPGASASFRRGPLRPRHLLVAPAALAVVLGGCRTLRDVAEVVTTGCPYGTRFVESADSGTPGLKKLTERYCMYLDEHGEKVRHGAYTELYDHGQKSEQGTYTHGHRVGRWTTWFPTGATKSTISYRDGKPESLVAWYDTGKKWEEGAFVDGQKQGLWRGWFENGKPSYQATYDRGTLVGDYVQWHDNGKKAEEGHYAAGARDGLWVRWYPNGVKRWELTFHEGKPNSVYRAWHENGRQSEQARFEEGKPIGVYTTWHDNGRKQEEGNYDHGLLNGHVTLWDRDGKVWSEMDLVDGEFLAGYGLAGDPAPRGATREEPSNGPPQGSG